MKDNEYKVHDDGCKELIRSKGIGRTMIYSK